MDFYEIFWRGGSCPQEDFGGKSDSFVDPGSFLVFFIIAG